jgi:hypothetical protein
MARVPTPGLTTQDHKLRRWLLEQAEEHGHAIVQVAGDDRGAPYAFTVGAWRRFGVAEAVVIGLPEEMSQVLLTAYVNQSRAGARFLPGTIHDGFFEDLAVAFEKVARGWYPEFLGSAFLLHPKGDFPAVQIILPSGEGMWPWEPDAPPGFARFQPVLTDSGLPESWGTVEA